MKRIVVKPVLLSLLLVLILLTFFACSSKENIDEIESSSDPSEVASKPNMTIVPISQSPDIEPVDEKLDPLKARAVLDEFLTADSLHLKCVVTYKPYDPSPVDPKIFEVWTKGLWYRSDEYEGSGIKFTIVVKEKDAKQYSMKSKNVLVPVSPPENYTDYYKWDTAAIDGGTPDNDGNYMIFTIDGIDRFYKKEGAQAGYYYTKVEFGVDNNKVLYLTLYGNSSYGDKPSGVNAVTQTYEFVNINEGFDDSIFNPPF
jgi:hypothetical protein